MASNLYCQTISITELPATARAAIATFKTEHPKTRSPVAAEPPRKRCDSMYDYAMMWKDKCDEMRERCTTERDVRLAMEAELNTAHTKLAKIKNEFAYVQKELADAQKELANTKEELAKAKQELLDAHKKTEAVKIERDMVITKMEALDSELMRVNAEIHRLTPSFIVRRVLQRTLTRGK